MEICKHLKSVDEMPTMAAYRFVGKTSRQKIDQNDIIEDLFDLGMSGNFYAQVIQVPEEFPSEKISFVDLYEPEEAAKIFAELAHYTLLDTKGRVIVGRMPGQEERK